MQILLEYFDIIHICASKRCKSMFYASIRYLNRNKRLSRNQTYIYKDFSITCSQKSELWLDCDISNCT